MINLIIVQAGKVHYLANWGPKQKHAEKNYTCTYLYITSTRKKKTIKIK